MTITMWASNEGHNELNSVGSSGNVFLKFDLNLMSQFDLKFIQ